MAKKKADPPPTPNPRLKAARKAKKLTLEALSADVDISVSQLSRFESGERQPRVEEVKRIAARLGVEVPDIVEGFDQADTVPIVGYVGAGAAMSMFVEGQGTGERVSAPDGATESTVAAEIRGTSLGELFDTWLVYYDEVRNPPTSDLLGHICVVGLLDGRILVKKLKRGQLPNSFHLLSNTEPPIYDAEVSWAAKVKQMSPR